MNSHCFLVVLFLFLQTFHVECFVGPTCSKMKEVAGPLGEKVHKMYVERVCNKGCKPVIAHYDKWARKNAVIPAIELVMKKMGVPQHAKSILGLAEDVVKAIKQSCSKQLGNSHFCQDPQTLKAFGECLKSNLMPVVMSKVGELMPLVAEPMCVKEKKYLEGPDLPENVIPNYMDKYAQACNGLN